MGSRSIEPGCVHAPENDVNRRGRRVTQRDRFAGNDLLCVLRGFLCVLCGSRPSLRELILDAAFVAALTSAILFPPYAAGLAAGEKSGVAPNTVSLPSGPGSIEGLGESFQPMLHTGTASHSFPIGLPAGGPGLSLAYDGGFGNGPVGFGWKFGPGDVKRQTERGVPRYIETSDDDTFLGIGGTELVELKNGFFLSRIEGSFTRYRRIRPDPLAHPESFHWEAHSRDGTRYEFGPTESGRVAQPAAESPAGRERIFRWLLERSTDVHGNVVEYRWSDLARPEDREKHLVEVRWGPGAPPWSVFHFARFAYEERPDWFVDCRSGFPVRQSFRLKRIDIAIHGAPQSDLGSSLPGDFNGDSLPDALIRRYEFLYEGHRHWSFLTQITLVGADGESNLPPAAFRYGPSDDALDVELSAEAGAAASIDSENAPAAVNDRDEIALVDLNGDGLPDLLHTSDGLHRGYLNRGARRFDTVTDPNCPAGPLRIVWSGAVEPASVGPGAPAALEYRLREGAVHLADMDADGLSDLVVTEGDLVRYYPNLGNLEERAGGQPQLPQNGLWGAPREMTVEGIGPPPPFDPEMEGSVRTIDLDFDKRMDVLQSFANGYVAWINRGGGEYSEMRSLRGAVFEGEVLEFRDRRVKLADLNGDRLVDVARIEAVRVIVALSLGWGEFADAAVIEIPDGVLGPQELPRAELKDLNGDGLSDLIVERADAGGLWLWWNLGTGQLSRRRTVEGIEEVSAGAKVEWADVNGNGSTDVVYSDSRLCSGRRVRAIDLGQTFDGSAHPRLLKTTDNGLGARTEIAYRSSSEFYEEARAAGNPWKVSNPNPVHVVARVETSTGLDLDGVPGLDVQRADYVYRDGSYDPVRRQFSGFGFVKRILRGDEDLNLPPAEISAPTLVERHAFHTGAPDGLDNDLDGSTDEAEEWMGREEEPLKGAQLWLETASLPDDPLKDGAFADAAVVFQRVATPLDSFELRTLAGPAGGVLADFFGNPDYASARPDRRAVLLVNKQVDTFIIEQGRGAPRQLRVTSDANGLGDPLFRWEHGEIVNGVPADAAERRYTSFEYAHNLPVWILGLPSRTRVRAGDAAGGFVSETRSYYDGDPFVGLPLGQIGARGLLHRSESFISEPSDWTPTGPSLPAIEEESRLIGDPRLPGASVNTARSEFDARGNAIALLDANGNRREVDYDAALEAYPVRERIFTGGPGDPLEVEVRVNLVLAAVVESRDLNGHVTTYARDVFGRPTSVVAPGDSPAKPTSIYRYAAANPQPLPGTRQRPGDAPLAASTPLSFEYDEGGALTLTSGENVPRVSSVRTSARERSGEDETLDSVAFADGAGRTLAALSEGDDPGEWFVSGTSRYNARGQARRSFQPYAQSTADWTPPAEGISPHSDVFYDAAGRPVRTVAPPDAENVRHEARIVYRPLQVDSWDGEDTLQGGRHAGAYTSAHTDGLGRAAKIVERNSLVTDLNDIVTEYETRYFHTSGDQLAAIQDAQGNRKYVRYDGLGRKIFLNDLNAGRRFYSYDAAGSLINFVDARGQRTAYTYDGAGRPLAVNYLDKTGVPATDPIDVVYRYDVPSGDVDLGDGTRAVPQNVRGRLVSVADLSGESHSSYDGRGRPEWAVKAIPDPWTGIPVSYATRFAYDGLNRVTAMVYPDGDAVRYEYCRCSQLRSVRGGPNGRVVVSDMWYLPSGSLERAEFGNGVLSTYSYDARLRLRDALTLGAGTTAGKEILHRSYRFDGVSNITAVKDLRPDVGAADPRHNSQLFEYDDLYRLTRYGLTDAALGANRGAIEYRYDRIGNLLYLSSPAAGPGHIDHDEKGKTVVNLGIYDYAGGRTGRVGRAPADPPGPHAVTGTASGRSYSYDPNGNMTSIDGLAASWDFEDRLVRLDGDGKTVEYAYDHAGQRVAKKVSGQGPDRFVLYVGEHFEVRDGEEPTKYVFAGGRRVARVKGTLDPDRPRIQRFRLVEGWNMQAIAVSPPVRTARTVFGLGDDPAVTSVATFDGTTFTPLLADAPIPLGVPFWVLADEPRARTIVGTYGGGPPAPIVLPTPSQGFNIAGWPRLDALRVEEAFGGLTQAWSYSGLESGWLVKSFPATSPADNLLGPLPPGAGVWAFATSVATFDPTATADQDVLFYHSDHLGSTSVVTDLKGAVVEETAYYPFGTQRHESHGTSWSREDYKFTGKERDKESGLYYYGARYYEPVVGRFVSADPLYVETASSGGSQTLSVYSYVLNNPLRLVDPLGFQSCEPGAGGAPGACATGQEGSSPGFAIQGGAFGALAATIQAEAEHQRYVLSLGSSGAGGGTGTRFEPEGQEFSELEGALTVLDFALSVAPGGGGKVISRSLQRALLAQAALKRGARQVEREAAGRVVVAVEKLSEAEVRGGTQRQVLESAAKSAATSGTGVLAKASYRVDAKLLGRLNRIHREGGSEALLRELGKVDPEDLKNLKRFAEHSLEIKETLTSDPTGEGLRTLVDMGIEESYREIDFADLILSF